VTTHRWILTEEISLFSLGLTGLFSNITPGKATYPRGLPNNNLWGLLGKRLALAEKIGDRIAAITTNCSY